MTNICVLAKKEVKSFFVSPVPYVVLAIFLLINGFGFYLIVSNVANSPGIYGKESVMRFFFGSFFFWFCMWFIIPLMTMRLLSEEKRSGTIEILLTSPITEVEVVLAKFISTFLFYAVLWLPTVLYPLMINIYTDVDWGQVAGGYLGVLLIGAFLISIGLLSSALTKNQIIAAIVSCVVILMLFLVGLAAFMVDNQAIADVVSYISFLDDFDDFARGVVDTRYIVYYLSATVFLLFLSVRVIESRKWR